jgi:hypothetical protein
MVYAKAFFDLQLQFAHKVTELSGLPLPRVLLEYTNLYIRFGLGRDFIEFCISNQDAFTVAMATWNSG